MTFARRIIQAFSCLAGLVAGLLLLNSCIFPTKCGESAAITDGNFSKLSISIVANGGGEPPSAIVEQFIEVQPLSLEIRDTEVVLTYETTDGRGTAIFSTGN